MTPERQARLRAANARWARRQLRQVNRSIADATADAAAVLLRMPRAKHDHRKSVLNRLKSLLRQRDALEAIAARGAEVAA